MVETVDALICADLDGTLLSPEKEVRPEVHAAIAEAARQHICFAISSGRHPFNVFDLLDALGLERTCTCLSGAATFVDGERIAEIGLPFEAVAASLAVAAEEGAYVSVAGADFNISCGEVSRGREAKASAFSRYERADSFDELAAVAKERRASILKLAFHGRDEAQYLRLREKLGEISGVRCVRSDALWLDVTSPSCTKAAGVRALARHLGVPASRVAVIGDDENDIEAVAEAGFGIAMGNAIGAVKEAARLVVADNAHGGAAEAIRAAKDLFRN